MPPLSLQARCLRESVLVVCGCMNVGVRVYHFTSIKHIWVSCCVSRHSPFSCDSDQPGYGMALMCGGLIRVHLSSCVCLAFGREGPASETRSDLPTPHPHPSQHFLPFFLGIDPFLPQPLPPAPPPSPSCPCLGMPEAGLARLNAKTKGRADDSSRKKGSVLKSHGSSDTPCRKLDFWSNQPKRMRQFCS